MLRQFPRVCVVFTNFSPYDTNTNSQEDPYGEEIDQPQDSDPMITFVELKDLVRKNVVNIIKRDCFMTDVSCG